MNLRSIHRRLPLTYAGIALLSALALGGVLLFTLREYYGGLERRHLQGNAEGIAAAMAEMLQAGTPEFVIKDLVSSWAFFLQARVRLFDAEGNLLADSGFPEMRQVMTLSSPPGGDVFIQGASRPARIIVSGQQSADGKESIFQMFLLPSVPGEDVVYAARKECAAGDPACGPAIVKVIGGPGDGPVVESSGPEIGPGELVTTTLAVAARPVGMVMPFKSTLYGFTTRTLGEEGVGRSRQQVERPVIGADEQRLGSILLSEGPAYGQEILRSVARSWLFSGLAAVLLAGLAGWRVSRNITRPLLALSEATGRMAAGDLGARAAVQSQDEFGDLGRSFNEMAGRVETTVGALRNFVSDAAHQLHTPLTALNTYLELAHDEADASRKGGYLEAAAGQALRLEGLINGLLELSRLEAGQRLHESVDLNNLAGELAEVFASQAEQAGVQFRYATPAEDAAVSGDPRQLREALANLLDNAFKFTPPGGEVRLEVSVGGDEAVVAVADSGIGIPPEDLPRLFGRFYRGRNASAYPGSGLGLAIVRSIAEAHGGEVSAETLDPGARFILRLPRLRNLAEDILS